MVMLTFDKKTSNQETLVNEGYDAGEAGQLLFPFC